MKYALAVVILAVVVAAMLMLGPDDSSRDRAGASRPVDLPGPTVGVLPEPTIMVLLTLQVPEVTILNASLSQEDAVASARDEAARMHEYNPIPIDAVLTTQADARDRLRQSSATWTEGQYPPSVGDSDRAAVWVVRMRGEFQAPQEGQMFVVLNAVNGQTLGYGHDPDPQPSR